MSQLQKEQKFKNHYDALVQPLFRFIYFKTRDEQLSQDIVQDAFVKYWDKMDTIAVSKEKSYLYTTAKNLLLNKIAHDKVVKKHQERSDDVQSETPLYQLEVSEFEKKLNAGLEELPDKQREVFLMHRMEGFKYKEIAEKLEISQKAVEKRMSLALIQLRKICSSI